MKTVLKTSMLALALLASFGASASIIEIGDNADGGDEGYPGSHIAIGDNADVQFHGIAIGDNATTQRGLSVGDGTFSAEFGAAFGTNAAAAGYASTAIGPNTLALAGAFAGGNGATARGFSSVVIGEGAYSHDLATNSVVLGSQSETYEADVVSVGNATLKRRVTNVGFATADNDALVYAQVVPALNGLVAGLGGGATYDPSTGVMTAPSYVLSMGTYDNVGAALTALDNKPGGGGGTDPLFAAQGDRVNMPASATGVRSLAAGEGALAPAEDSTAVGAHSEANFISGTAIGAYARAEAYCTSLGYGAECTEHFTASFGRVGEEVRLVNVAAGINATDAATVGQIAPFAAALGGGSNFNGGVFTPPAYAFISGAVYNDVGSALADLDGRVNNLEQNPGGGTPGPAGADGDSAYQVAVSNGFAGSETDWLASLKGDKGDTGERGEQGLPGEPGTGSTEPGPEGPAGQDGVDGIDGRSAYEVAIENGFEGTEEEWLASLEGTDGRDGVDGKDGAGKKLNGGSNIAVSDNEDGTQTASLKDNVELSDQGSVKVGATTVNAQGVSIAGGPSMTTKGIDAGHQRVTSVAAGRIEQGSMDAVNGGQIWALDDRWNDRWTQTNDRIDGLGAQLGAFGNMANTPGTGGVTAGLGFSGSKAALAVGWSKRINDKVSISVGAAFGGGNRPVYGMGIRIGGTP